MSVDTQNTPRTELVNLVRLSIGLRRGMSEHLLCNVAPHISTDGLMCVKELATYLDTADGLHPELAEQLGVVIDTIRATITAGTRQERIQIPPQRLIGCKLAYDTHPVRSEAAEALFTALPQIVAFHSAVRQAIDLAEALRVSMQMIAPDGINQ
jgi:RecA/RadA recombinase